MSRKRRRVFGVWKHKFRMVYFYLPWRITVYGGLLNSRPNGGVLKRDLR